MNSSLTTHHSPLPSWRQHARPGVSLAEAQAAHLAPGNHSPGIPPQLLPIILPGARDRWIGAQAASYTPDRIDQVLRSAFSGNLVGQWELFDLMEGTWPRLAKNLNELKRAVKACDRTVEPWAEEDESPNADAAQRARLVSRALWTMQPRADENQNGYDDTINDILDAWAKGVAVLEIDWQIRDAGKLGQIVGPRCTRWIHPRFYGYPAQADWLGLNVNEVDAAQAGSLENATLAGFDSHAPRITHHAALNSPSIKLTARDASFARFPSDKFLICTCKARSGHPSVSALLRPLAFWWCASNFTQSSFLNFAQLFGLPIRWANYDPNTPGLMENISQMLKDMGSSAWAAFPAGTTLELKEPMKAGADNPQVALLDRADRQCDILILGQTLTTDVADSGSRALGTVHKSVRDDVVQAAANFVATVINQQLIPSIISLNFGDKELLPEVCFSPRKIEDTKANAERDEILLGQGVEMPKAWFYKRHQIPMPGTGEETITGKQSNP